MEPPPTPLQNPVSPSGDESGEKTKTPPRGRGRTHYVPERVLSPKRHGGKAENGGGEHETAAWEAALSRAVGTLVRADADACAPKLRSQ